MKKSHSVLGILLTAATFTAQGCASRQSPRDLIRATSSVRLVQQVDIQGFADSVSVRAVKGAFTVRTSPEAPHLPFAKIARELLTYADLEPESDDSLNSGIVLSIKAQGRALTRDYKSNTSKVKTLTDDQLSIVPGSRTDMRVFTVPSGLYLQGTVALEISGAAFRQTDFKGEVRPPPDTAIQLTYSPFSEIPLYLEYTKPSGTAACNRPGSFTQKTVDLLGDIFGISFLLAAIESQSHPIDEYAAEVLSHLDVERTDEDLLITALAPERQQRIRLLAAEVLGKTGGKRAVKALLTAARDPEWRVRWQAVAALGRIADKQAVETLATAMRDPEWQVRQKATEALGQLASKQAVEPLLTAVRDPEWRVRRQAIEALGKRGDARAVEPLLTAVRDPEYGVRYQAVVALDKFRDPRAIEPLIAALRDPDAQFQKRAWIALINITGEDFAADPDLWLEWLEKNRKENWD